MALEIHKMKEYFSTAVWLQNKPPAWNSYWQETECQLHHTVRFTCQNMCQGSSDWKERSCRHFQQHENYHHSFLFGMFKYFSSCYVKMFLNNFVLQCSIYFMCYRVTKIQIQLFHSFIFPSNGLEDGKFPWGILTLTLLFWILFTTQTKVYITYWLAL